MFLSAPSGTKMVYSYIDGGGKLAFLRDHMAASKSRGLFNSSFEHTNFPLCSDFKNLTS